MTAPPQTMTSTVVRAQPVRPTPAHRSPGAPVEQRTDPEEQRDGHRVDRHGQLRAGGRGRPDQRGARHQRDEEGHLVEDAPQPGLDRRAGPPPRPPPAGAPRPGSGPPRSTPPPLVARRPPAGGRTTTRRGRGGGPLHEAP